MHLVPSSPNQVLPLKPVKNLRLTCGRLVPRVTIENVFLEGTLIKLLFFPFLYLFVNEQVFGKKIELNFYLSGVGDSGSSGWSGDWGDDSFTSNFFA